MSLNSVPTANRIHIGLFGRRNVGKSSLINAITSQDLSVVSDVKGTTTDIVSKAMELLPLGAVVITDTPGIDDTGALGELRVKKTKQAMNKADIAVLVTDINDGLGDFENELIDSFKKKNIPYIIVYNKVDTAKTNITPKENEIFVSATSNIGINELKERIGALAKNDNNKPLVGDLISENDFVVLVTPIDESAPKGRLILPQQQTIRDLLDSGATTIVVRETELENTLNNIGKKPSLVICDSQVFGMVNKIVPNDIPLTSFSVLMARYKGFLDTAVNGAYTISELENNDKILICEGCTHHRQCNDIGSVKLPNWLRAFTKKELDVQNTSGSDFPEDLSPYSLVIHCGGCMLTEREVQYRMKCAIEQNVPFTNYGTAIAYMNGILERSLEIFKI